MNELASLAGVSRAGGAGDDLVALSVDLAAPRAGRGTRAMVSLILRGEATVAATLAD